MEAPSPIIIEECQETQNENYLNLEKKYYLKMNNLEYNLKIFYNTNEITFQIDNNNKILLYNYKKRYYLKEIISILNLSSEIYNETKKIVELIDNAFIDGKLKLKLDDKNNNILLIIKIKNLFRNQEKDYTIKINKNIYNINEKFDIIIKELENLRQNNSALFEIEKKIESLKYVINNKLEENILLIESLQAKIKNNKEQLENNDYQIKLLKTEIFNLKNIGKNMLEENEAKDKIKVEIKDKIKDDNINEKNKYIIDEQNKINQINNPNNKKNILYQCLNCKKLYDLDKCFNKKENKADNEHNLKLLIQEKIKYQNNNDIKDNFNKENKNNKNIINKEMKKDNNELHIKKNNNEINNLEEDKNKNKTENEELQIYNQFNAKLYNYFYDNKGFLKTYYPTDKELNIVKCFYYELLDKKISIKNIADYQNNFIEFEVIPIMNKLSDWNLNRQFINNRIVTIRKLVTDVSNGF